MSELLGANLDLGAALAAMTRLAAADAVDALCTMEPAVNKVMPPLTGAASRLANWLDGPYFENVRVAIARRVLTELTSPRRLHPTAEGEIIVLRALAMALTAAAGRILSLEDVQQAFIERAKMLVRADFIEAYLGKDRTSLGEVEALLWLAENVTGAANKRGACRWISTNVSALKFEMDIRSGPDSAATKLIALADLQRLVARAGFVPEDAGPVLVKIGEVGGLVEADGKLTADLAEASGPVLSRLTALLHLATGESAPLGPAADRAKARAIRLIRLPDTRAELAKSPKLLGSVLELMKKAEHASDGTRSPILVD
jgi:hypothetical protein